MGPHDGTNTSFREIIAGMESTYLDQYLNCMFHVQYHELVMRNVARFVCETNKLQQLGIQKRTSFLKAIPSTII